MSDPAFALRAPRAHQARRTRLGRQTEVYVTHLNRACALAGVARLERLHPACAGAPGNMRLVGKAPADFGGYMLDGSARAVLVEVKHLDFGATRFPLGRVEPHQADALEALHRAGGVAVLLVLRGHPAAPSGAWAIPWWMASCARNMGAASLLLESFSGCALNAAVPYLAPWMRGGR